MAQRKDRRLDETAILGPGKDFPSTHWSALEAAGASPEKWREHLEALATQYWKPIYRYLRLRWGYDNEKAKDLTQSFFLRILEGGLLEKADRGRGRFRAFVKACLENHVRMARREAGRLKRGGGRLHFRIDAEADGGPFEVPSPDASPAEILDAQWRAVIMERAVERVREAYAREGRPKYFEALDRFERAEPKPTYKDLARDLGLSAADVGNYLRHARARLVEIVREGVAESVSSPEALEREMKDLFPGLTE